MINKKSENDYQIGIMKKKVSLQEKSEKRILESESFGSERGKKAGQLYLKRK